MRQGLLKLVTNTRHAYSGLMPDGQKNLMTLLLQCIALTDKDQASGTNDQTSVENYHLQHFHWMGHLFHDHAFRQRRF